MDFCLGDLLYLSSRWISAWGICCTFLGTSIPYLAYLLPSHCFPCTLVTDFPLPFFLTAVI